MRVIILASGDLWAGAEMMVYQLISGLVETGRVKLCIALLNQERLADEIGRLGVDVRVIDESKYSFGTITRNVRAIVADFNPDIIHSHRYKENLLAWLACLGRPGIKLIATQHGMPEFAGKKLTLKYHLRSILCFRLLSCCFDSTVMVSKEMQQKLEGFYGFLKKNITVIHNGIYLPDSSIPCVGKRIAVGSAGRLFPVKDFALFVDIAYAVALQSDSVDFFLAGEGPQLSMLKAKVKELNMQKRFHFLGHVDDMNLFYRSLHIYINTSVHEGIPMSVLEAMSHGLPVILPNVGGFSEIIQDGIQGFLVEKHDKKKFVDYILRLANNKNLWMDMSNSAKEKVNNSFSRKAMTEEYIKLYKALTIKNDMNTLNQ